MSDQTVLIDWYVEKRPLILLFEKLTLCHFPSRCAAIWRKRCRVGQMRESKLTLRDDNPQDRTLLIDTSFMVRSTLTYDFELLLFRPQDGHHRWPDAGPDHRRRLDPGAPGRDRGSRRARPLRGRSSERRPQQPHRHARRAPVPVRQARAGRRQGQRKRRRFPRASGPPAARGLDGFPDLGPWNRAGISPQVHPGDGRRGLLLRSAKSQATWQQREHQRPPAPVLPARHGPVKPDQDQLDAVALSLNTRPRKTLGYRTPADTLNKAVVLIG